MKICQVGTGFTSIPPQISAATEEVVYYISKELSSLGCDMSTLDIIDRKNTYRQPFIKEVPYFSFIKSTKSNSPGLILKRASFSFFAARWLKEFGENYDIIHFHNQFPAYSFHLLTQFSKSNSRIFYTVHNPIWGLSDNEIPRNVRLKFILEVEAIKSADKVIAVSETLRRNITKRLGLNPSSVVAIPNGVDTDKFHPNRLNSFLRNQLAPKGEKIVLCIGRVSKYKGQKKLVESIPLIVRDCPNTKFVFVGPIDDSKYFKEITKTIDSVLFRKFCVFTGIVMSDLVPEYIATADVCAVLSITEAGPPLTLFQAMSSSKAIVASAIPQNIEAAKIGDELVFVDPLNVKEISSAIIHLLSNENRAKRLGEKSRKTVLENFDWKATAKNLLRLYEQTN